jgi:hypothetical protein
LAPIALERGSISPQRFGWRLAGVTSVTTGAAGA